RIAAEEAAHGGVVDAGTELRDAEGSERVTTVPLLVAVEETTRLGAGRVRLAERLIVDVLDQRTGLVGEEPAAPLPAEGEHPRAAWAMAGGDEAIGAGDLAGVDRRPSQRALGDQAEVTILSRI